MWVAEYLDDLADLAGTQQPTSAAQMITKHLRGPVCVVGRKIDCDISFMKDKSTFLSPYFALHAGITYCP